MWKQGVASRLFEHIDGLPTWQDSHTLSRHNSEGEMAMATCGVRSLNENSEA